MLLIVEHEPLATLLSDSEDVSHENWKTRGADLVTQRYERGPSTVQFVRSAVRRLAHILMTPTGVRDTTLLQDIFFVEEPSTDDDLSDVGDVRGTRTKNKPSPEPIVGPFPAGSPKAFTRSSLADGFAVHGNRSFDGEMKPIEIRMAYATFKRNPFTQYREFDFSLKKVGQLKVALGDVVESLDEAIRGPNVVRVTPRSNAFSVVITGFDRNRALEVAVRSERSSEETDNNG